MKTFLNSSTRALIALLAIALSTVAKGADQTSDLWGAVGEKWKSAGGALPDFSYAGYQRGEKPLPSRTPDVSVKDYGSVGDGAADDTAAIQKAIDANPGKTIRLPAGRYRLSDVVTIRSSGTVLQGEGPDKTIFVAPVSLQEIHPLPVSYPDTGGTAYAYSGGFIAVAGSTSYFDGNPQPVTAPAERGAVTLQLAAGHSFKADDEVVVIASDTAGQTLLRYLYRDDSTDLSKAGTDRSFRHVSRVKSADGTTLTLERPLRTELRMEWKPEVRLFQPRLQEVGIEHLGFEFPAKPYMGHFTEKGFNAITINGVAHSWVRNVSILNADSGISLGGSVFSTVTGIVIESKRRASNPHNATGHHGISLVSLDCLCTSFEFRTSFIHDLTVSNNSVGNVFSNGKAPDMSLDHHKRAPYENLFSNLDLGKGERMFMSGGHDGIGRNAAAGNTYWNLASRSSVEMPEGFGPARLNFVGVRIRARGKPQADGLWVEAIRPGAVQPADLHLAMLQKRLGGRVPSGDAPSETAAASAQSWKSSDGRVIEAQFGGLTGDQVTLIRDGKSFPIPLSRLAPESRALARKLAAP